MKCHQVVLSLGKWPQQPYPHHIKLSPITLRIVKEVNVEPESLLPVTYPQFIVENNLTNTSESYAGELYNQELKRRRQKVQIIKKMWVKVKFKRSKSTRNTFVPGFSYVPARSIVKSQRNSSKSLQSKHLKKKSVSPPLAFNLGSPKHNSTYHDYYNTNCRRKLQEKKPQLQQSTKSRRQRTKNSKNNEEYFNSKTEKNKQRKSVSSNKNNIISSAPLQQLLKKLSNIDQMHTKQLQQLSNVTEHEKRRLLKIHQIEKLKLQKQVERLQSKNTVTKKNKNNFTKY